ncbi:hypothetical protein C8Q76DRAFT_744199 [Earliella scabrosa]|nr:hypothetical protein C8Q76DRAFT_744199 [Earliella scabrosa]
MEACVSQAVLHPLLLLVSQLHWTKANVATRTAVRCFLHHTSHMTEQPVNEMFKTTIQEPMHSILITSTHR